MSFNKVPNVPGSPGLSALLKVSIIGGLGVYAISNSLYNVEGGHRAVMFNRLTGIKEKVYPEGTHIMVPWFERPIIYDVRARPYLVESTTGSHDLQMVKIGLRVLTRPMGDRLPQIYRTLGENYSERVLPSIIHETLKAVVAQYNASQLITQREAVSREIRKILTERASNFDIALDDVSITTLTFGKEFTAAIEAKQVAAQEAERAKFIVEKAEQDRRSAVIRAQGEAKSAQLIGQAIANNQAFITLRKIEAAREIAQTIAQSANESSWTKTAISGNSIFRPKNEDKPSSSSLSWLTSSSPKPSSLSSKGSNILVMENAVVVFARRGCCMGHVAKRLLLTHGVNPLVVEIDEEDNNDNIIIEVGQTAVNINKEKLPVMFIGGKLFGGLENLMAAHINGDLVPTLRQAGALWL